MKKKIFNQKRPLFYLSGSFIIIFIIGFLIINYLKKEKEFQLNDLININNLSEKFMEEYLEGTKKLEKNNNKENILIVTSLEKLTETFGATDVVEAPNNQYFLQYSSSKEKEIALKNFKTDENIIFVDENKPYTTSTTTYNSWGVKNTGIDNAISVAESNDLEEIVVAVIDSGCNTNYFKTNYPGKIIETYNVSTQNSTVTDYLGHGTHVAGTIAEATPSNVKILPIKASYANENAFYDIDLISAINYVTHNNKAEVINMSLAGPSMSNAVYVALEAAKNQNIITVAAAGNESTSLPYYPAAFDNTLSISAVDENFELANFSNKGNKIDFAAPGVNILSVNGTASGTSMAAPHVASAVAILKSFDKDMTFDETIDELKTQALDLGDKGRDNWYGHGLIVFDTDTMCQKEEGCLFKSNNTGPTIDKLELSSLKLTKYNFASLTNILGSIINVYYDDNIRITKKLWEIEGIEITGYDPLNDNPQNVTIKYNNQEIVIKVDHPDNYTSGWEYELVNDTDIKIINHKFISTNETVEAGILYVPDKLDGYNVVALGDENDTENTAALRNAYYYRKVVLPSTLTKIGNYAFAQPATANSIETVISEAEEIKIGAYAFYNTYIKEITSTITSLAESSFEGTYHLEKINLKNITEIPKRAFANSGITNIVIPKTVSYIGEEAFRESNIYKIDIPEGITSLETRVFYHCENLTEVQLPESLKTIGYAAFYRTNIKDLYIPKNVITIDSNAFAFINTFENISVSLENNFFDSRNNSNALIETSTNKLLIASQNTIIPDSIEVISSSSFRSYTGTEIVVPESVKTIDSDAFWDAINLEKVTFHGGLTLGSSIVPRHILMIVHDNSAAQTYAKENSISYETMEPERAKSKVTLTKTEYYAFEELDTTDMIIELVYDEGRTEIVDEYEISYSGQNSSFRYGHTYAIVDVINSYGYKTRLMAKVTVKKAIPTYEKPKEINAYIGQTLSQIELPNNFEWENPEEQLTEIGTKYYSVKFIPEDTNNYEIVENIEVTVKVAEKSIIKPTISIIDKIYNGGLDVEIENIKIDGLNEGDYTIEYATLSSPNVGNVSAAIKIKLTDSKYINSSFEDGLQEKEFRVNVNIIAQKLTKPTAVEKTYVYNTLEQTIELNDYDNEKMNVEGNKRTNAGEQNVTISLKSNNYIWADGTSRDVILKFKIEKATPEYEIPTGLTAEIGQKLSEIELPENFNWMDGNQIIENTGNQTFKAKYTPTDTDNYKVVENIDININIDNKLYSVTFDANGGTGTMENQIFSYGEAQTLNEMSFVKEGFRFKEWNTKSDGTGTVYCDKQEITIGKNLTLYAQWEEMYSYIINNYTYDDNKMYISKIGIETTVDEYKSNFDLNAGYTLVVDYKTVYDQNVLYTGSKTKIYNEQNLVAEYTNIVKGDVNGDGKISVLDIIQINNHIIDETKQLGEIYALAGNYNDDTRLSVLDIIQINNYIIGE